jgi:hypothetical protein
MRSRARQLTEENADGTGGGFGLIILRVAG